LSDAPGRAAEAESREPAQRGLDVDENDSRCQAAATALRASQINGCGWCVDLHTKEAAAAGETAVRLNLAAAWREATVFTEGYVSLPATRVLHAPVMPEIWAVLAGGAAWACPA
jgi:AhpD family alkylhydroperoxidase